MEFKNNIFIYILNVLLYNLCKVSSMLKRLRVLLFIVMLGIIVLFSYLMLKYKGQLKNYESGNSKTIIEDEVLDVEQVLNEIDEKKNENFYSCYMGKMSEDDYSPELKNKVSEINNYFKSSNTRVSFAYEDLYTGLHLSYNEDQLYFAASVIKSPVIMYVYKMSSENLLDLNEVLTYTSSFYMGGTGSLQYEQFGGQYTIRELAKKAIIESDNVAYAMLCNRVNNSDIRNFWKNSGSSTFWSNNSIWGNVKSRDGVIYMKQLYNFLNENEEIKKELMEYYSNASLKLIKVPGTPIAHKSGWTNSAIHDMAIIYNNQPYVLSINTLLGEGDFRPFFAKASGLIDEFHNLYWREKQQICYDKYIKKNSE